MKSFYELKASTVVLTGLVFVGVISALSGYLLSYSDNIVLFLAGIFMAAVLGYFVYQRLNYLINLYREPVAYASRYIEKMANGEELEEIKNIYSGEFAVLMDNLGKVRKCLYTLLDEAGKLNRAANEGNLHIRGDIKDLKGGYADIIKEINSTIDSIISPFNEAKQVLQRMAANDYTMSVTGQYKGAVNEFTESVNSVRARFLSVQDIFTRISKGDFSRLDEFKSIGRRSDNDQMVPAVIAMMENILNIVHESDIILEGAAVGNLSIRGDIRKFTGEYTKIIAGFNSILDIIELPLNEANKVLRYYADNDISVSMKGEYKGIFKDFSDNINLVHERLFSIQDTFICVAKGDMSKLDEIKKVGKRSENDVLLPSMIGMMEAIKGLTDEVEMLIKSAQNGELNKRADTGMFKGEYKMVLDGFNKTLDIIIEPINEAMKVMGSIAVNDYTSEMTGKYSGMLKEFTEQIGAVKARLLSLQDVAIKVSKGDTSRLDEFIKAGKRSENDKLLPSFRNMMQVIQDLINETNILADAAVNGNLTVRGNVDKFEGGYRDVIIGINKTMDAVAQPVQEASAVLQEMAKGNLTVSMVGDYKGDYAKLKDALNFSIDSFNEVLNDINIAAHQVASGARQVSDSAQTLSQGATEQASSIEELTASVEEISTQTKHNASNANQANEMSLNAKDDAVKGNEQMKEMLKAMNEINTASSDISKIIKVIDEIAFQTNILALNAAVEAARAGQHGKGFAVVAEEVRNLAARSANAAKETTVLIEGSIRKAEDGTKIASETAGALDKIVEIVSKSAELVGDIANSSNEQAVGIAQINQGIMQVSQVVQNNSATSQESAAASQELSGQAEILKELAGKFRLNKSYEDYKAIDGIGPEVLRMIENMNEAKTKNINNKSTMLPNKSKIALSEKEFGKY